MEEITEVMKEAIKKETAKINEKIKKMYDLRAQKDELAKQTKELNKAIDALEFDVLKYMEEQEFDKLSTTVATVTRKVVLHPQIKDIQALGEWASTTGRFDIFQKRVTTTVFNEYLEQEGEYPDGIDTYNKESLGFRKAK